MYLPNFSTDVMSSWLPPKSTSIFSQQRYVFHLIPTRSFVFFSHTALSAMAGALFFGMFLTLYCHFNFLATLLVSSGWIPGSALTTALLLDVLEHPTALVSLLPSALFPIALRTPRSLPIPLLNIPVLVLLRGTIVNRTYGMHKKPTYLAIFTNSIRSYQPCSPVILHSPGANFDPSVKVRVC